jgi:hypothetical protein
VIGRILHARRGGEREAWALQLFDKRDAYVRTHRLRLDPAPFAEIQRELEDPRFDGLVGFLREHDHCPEVNVLEQRLLALAGELGVTRERLAIGPGPGEVELAELRARLEGPVTIVGADSVHSAVREAVRGAVEPVRFTHQRVARLRVVGPGLPAQLGVVDRYRLSKVLGSLLDYRLNRNGFAEVDLFLGEREHDSVRALGGTPSAPAPITARALSGLRAPLFRRIVDHLERGLAGARCEVLLQSTFELEHAVMPRLAFAPPDLGARVFLVGDAAVSLPFFRGMACLARCAHALARVHCDLALGGDADALALRYDREAGEIARRELSVVAARGRLVRGLREFARLSALLPFPIQSWWLSARDAESPPDHASFGLWLNVGLALAAAATLAGVPLGEPRIAWASLPLELAGGVAYHAALELESGPHRWVRRVWQVQIAAVLVAGVAFAARTSMASGRLEHPLAAAWWFVLAIPFVAGLYLLEALGRRWAERAELGE